MPWRWIIALMWATALVADEAKLNEARAFLAENQLREASVTPPSNDTGLRERIASTRDPGTQFGYVVFSLARKGTGILSAEQLKQMEAVIATRRDSPVNWHDVRNVVRVQAMLLLFPHALATEESELESIRAEWNAWTDLRQAFMFQEFIAQERFQRAAWSILTTQQKEMLLSGALDAKLKKSTGHSRAFFADRIVQRALGKPDHAEAFALKVDEWRTQWNGVQRAADDAAKFDRQREFAMDLADEDFAVAAWQTDAPVFRAWAEAERDAIRDLVQAGYEIDADLHERVARLVGEQRAEMPGKYRGHAADLLRRLGELSHRGGPGPAGVP